MGIPDEVVENCRICGEPMQVGEDYVMLAFLQGNMGKEDMNRVDSMWLLTIFHRSCFVTNQYKALSSVLRNVLDDMDSLTGEENEKNGS